MTTAATTPVATTAAMTEPIPASAAERLAALRSPSKDRAKPALAWKILTAGMSTSAMFGIIAAMGWGGTADSTTLPPNTAAQVVPVAPVVTVAVTTGRVTTISADDDTPAVVVPAPTPAAQPQKPVTRAASNTTTKSSS
jgi:hypothetical protein